jgi:hypothetical protein
MVNQREPAFDVGDGVQMHVTETGSDGLTRKLYKNFTIAARRIVASHWQYQLNDPVSKSLYEAGKWFPESRLTSST